MAESFGVSPQDSCTILLATRFPWAYGTILTWLYGARLPGRPQVKASSNYRLVKEQVEPAVRLRPENLGERVEHPSRLDWEVRARREGCIARGRDKAPTFGDYAPVGGC